MIARHIACRLCGETIEENDGAVIEENMREMLETVLIKFDLTITPDPVICKRCHEKLVANYNFKRKCIFIEDSITPFVSHNVKLDLNEVHNKVIKSEDVEDDGNICRLCLQFVDNDMTLSDDEKEQFQQFFPEIDLSHTNCLILCSTCYGLLRKYFIFVTSCLNLEQQLYNYSLDQAENKIDITEEHVGIKLENFQDLLKKEEDKNEAILDEELVLNEELDIKCDVEQENGKSNFLEDPLKNRRCMDVSCKIQLHVNLLVNCPQPERQRKCTLSKIETYQCENCTYRTMFKGNLMEHVEHKHFDQKHKSYLIQHGQNKHSNPSTMKMYNCKNYSYEAKQKSNLIRHNQYKHSDPFTIKMYKCENCSYETKQRSNLIEHIRNKPSDPSTIKMYKCDNCAFETKRRSNLIIHIRNKHSDPSTIKMYKCENCSYEAKQRSNLIEHIRNIHSDPSTIKMYKCDNCTFETKYKSYLIQHGQNQHSDPSTIKMYKCENCTFETKHRSNLIKHIQNKHSDPSTIKMYKCDNCTFKTKYKSYLIQHGQHQHSDPSTIKMYKCENCSYETKQRSNLMKHIGNKHSDPSTIKMYKCENCSYEAKQKSNLIQHIQHRHSDPSKIKMYM